MLCCDVILLRQTGWVPVFECSQQIQFFFLYFTVNCKGKQDSYTAVPSATIDLPPIFHFSCSTAAAPSFLGRSFRSRSHFDPGAYHDVNVLRALHPGRCRPLAYYQRRFASCCPDAATAHPLSNTCVVGRVRAVQPRRRRLNSSGIFFPSVFICFLYFCTSRTSKKSTSQQDLFEKPAVEVHCSCVPSTKNDALCNLRHDTSLHVECIV